MKVRKNFTRIIILLLGLSVFCGCSSNTSEDNVVAKVGNYEITVKGFNERISNLPEKYREVVKRRKNEYLEDLIKDTLLYQEAVRKDLDREEDVRNLIEEAKKKIIIARLLQDEVDNKVVITDEDIELFYTANKGKYMTPEIMRVSHILVLSKDDADKIAEEINRGANFEDLARAKSVDPTAQRAGDIGYFPKGQILPEFEEACSLLQIGDISGIVETTLGYHIIKLTDRKAPRVRPLSDVKNDVKARLRVLKKKKLFKNLLGEIKQKTNIEINKEILNKQI